MINIEELIDEYVSARDIIAVKFGCPVWHNIIVYTECKWDIKRNVRWTMDGKVYSIDNHDLGHECDDFILFKGHDCTGNQDLYLFRLSNKVEDVYDEI